MDHRPLGRTGIDVSRLCLGTMTWGSQNSEAEAHAQLDLATANGVTFIDTAELYPVTPYADETFGDTEHIVGTWLEKRGRRDDLVLATKVAGKRDPQAPAGGPIDAAKLREECEASLKRLRTDMIDLYQLHWPNRGHYHFRRNWKFAPEEQDTAAALSQFEDCIGELGRLVESGKIRAWGLSNETVWGTMQHLAIGERIGAPRMASMQNEYSLLYRLQDTDFAEMYHHEEVSLLTYTSLAAGLLTGKYEGNAIPEGSRRALNPDLHGRVNDTSMAAASAYVAIARRHGLDPAQMALAWCLTRPFVTSVIVGATSVAQLETCLGAADVTLSDDVMAEIAATHRRFPMPF